jgi:putative phage-type endonuclease
MKIYQELEQGSEEWLKLRLGKFGGTDAQAVATNGKGLETLCFEKVGEIITGRLKEQYKNEDMQRGNELEKTARLAYEMETSNIVTKVGYIELNEFIGVSPDGLVGEDGMIEIKCPCDAVFVRFLYDKKIDTKYEWQMQHQMFVSGRKWVDYVLFNDNLNKIEVNRVERDEAKIEKLRIGTEAGVLKIKEILSKVKEN